MNKIVRYFLYCSALFTLGYAVGTAIREATGGNGDVATWAVLTAIWSANSLLWFHIARSGGIQ